MRKHFIEKLNLFYSDERFENEIIDSIKNKTNGLSDDEILLLFFEEIIGDELTYNEKDFVLGEFKNKILEIKPNWFEEFFR